jgi:hypothetical protein
MTGCPIDSRQPNGGDLQRERQAAASKPSGASSPGPSRSKDVAVRRQQRDAHVRAVVDRRARLVQLCRNSRSIGLPASGAPGGCTPAALRFQRSVDSHHAERVTVALERVNETGLPQNGMKE